MMVKNILLVMLMLSGLTACGTTKSIKEVGVINIGTESNIEISIDIDVTGTEDRITIKLDGKKYFIFVLNFTNSKKTLEKDVKYKGNIVKAKCRFDHDSELTTLVYTAHNCSIFVNSKLEFQKII